jgi:hypothetical protein
MNDDSLASTELSDEPSSGWFATCHNHALWPRKCIVTVTG